MPTRDDLPPPRVLTNGVVVPPTLQINEMSCAEWHRRTQWDSLYMGLTKESKRSLALKMGFPSAQIERELGASP